MSIIFSIRDSFKIPALLMNISITLKVEMTFFTASTKVDERLFVVLFDCTYLGRKRQFTLIALIYDNAYLRIAKHSTRRKVQRWPDFCQILFPTLKRTGHLSNWIDPKWPHSKSSMNFQPNHVSIIRD